MKKVFIIIIFGFLSLDSFSQRLMLNEKAPKIDYSDIFTGEKPTSDRPLYVEFISEHMPNLENHLIFLSNISKKNSDKIQFIVIYKGDSETLEKLLLKKQSIPYTVIIDKNGKIFDYYDVRYTPKSVVLDEQQKFIWQGKLIHSDSILNNL